VVLGSLSAYSGLDTNGNLTVAGSATVTGQLSANGGKLRTTTGNTLIRGLTVNGSSDADPIVLAPASTGVIRLNRNLETLGNIAGPAPYPSNGTRWSRRQCN
jgi:hypothetical protein